VGASAPAFTTEEDAWDLAQTLADNGTGGLPLHSHIETMAADTTTPLQVPFGRVYTTVCTTVTIFPLNPMTPAEALLCGLLDTSGRLNRVAYDRMVRVMPGVVAGLLRPHHDAARPGRPRW
jgi:hypothetical protein